MADQRRYTADQQRRIQESGEVAPEGMSLPGRILRNAAVAVPRSLTDLVAASGMIVPAIQAGLSSEIDFPEAMYGKEGVAALQDYISQESGKLFSQLPVERQTDHNMKAISDAVANSEGAQRIRHRFGPINTKMGTEAGDALNDLVGLNPVRQETIVDDASQIAATAVIPSGVITKPLAKLGTSAAAKAARVAADVLVPGTAKYTPAGIATNVVLPMAASQGLRGVTDMPSVITGDALGPEYAGDLGDPLADPEAGMNGEQMAAAGAVVGSIVTAAAVMMGKANKLATKQLVDEMDNGVKVPGPNEELEPTLSRGQKIKSETIDQSSPMRDVIFNAGGDNKQVKETVANIERVTTNTANVNLNQMHTTALETGTLPLFDKKTVPLNRVNRMLASLPPQEIELFEAGMRAKTLLDQHALRLKSMDDELREARLGIKEGGQQARARVEAITAKRAAAAADDATLMGDMTVKDARIASEMMELNPQLKQAEAALRQFSSDIIDAKLADGQITAKTAERLRTSHPNHMMLQEDPLAGKTGIGRWWEGVKQEVRGSEMPSMYGNVRGPLLARSADTPVTNPKSALDSFRHYLYDHIQYTAMNDATRTFVNAVKNTPDFGRSIREIESMPLDEFHVSGESKKVKDRKNTFAYTENGVIHFMEAADPELLRALQFNAPSTLVVANLMRKVYQHGTTGFMRPVFGPIAAVYEDNIARATRQPGRSYGIVDATLRRAFPDSKMLSSVLDKVGGNPLGLQTSQLQMIAGLFQQLRHHEIKEVATKISSDLETKSGFFHLLSKMPGGKQFLDKLSETMIRSFNESRYGVFVNEGIKQTNLLDDPLKQVREGYTAVNYAMQTADAPRKFLWGQYKSMLEMVHNSSKYAFFAQNYAALQRKHGGNVPKKELDKLVSETRGLSGDMTRSVGNAYFGKALSAVPYGQVAVNSTYHLASAISRDPVNVGARILTGHIVPKIGAIALLSQNEELRNWYWNELPSWQRMSRIPVIGPSWWMDLAAGKMRALVPDDIYLMPEAPEMTMLSNTVITAVRTLGWFGDEPQATASFAKELGEGLEGVSSVATPPLLAALASGVKIDLGRIFTSPLTGKPIIEEGYTENPHQGINTTGINADSMISRSFSNALIALLGVAAGNALNSVDVAAQSLDDGQSFTDALTKAFQFSAYQDERSFPELPGTRELGISLYTNGQRRHYAGTQTRDRVMEVFEAFEPIQRQLTAEKDKSGASERAVAQGLDGLRTIQDPRVLALAQQMYSVLQKGKMKKLADERTELNKDLVVLDANRENMNPAVYHTQTVGIMQQMQTINQQQMDQIQMLESALLNEHGIDIDRAIEIIGASVGRQQQNQQ